MKLVLGLLGAVVLLVSLTGCVAIPPLVNVHHSDTGAKSRLDELEKRVKVLEEKVNSQ